MALCAGCNTELTTNANYLACSICKKCYDLECSNVLIEQFLRMNCENKMIWECQECRCKKPKNINTNTPARPQPISNSFTISPDANVTLRRKPSKNIHDETVCSEDSSIFGDTLCKEKNVEPELTLHSLSEMISLKLKENNCSIILEIKTTIQTEINKAISKLRDDMKQETNALSLQNEERKTEIEKLNTQIQKLQIDTEKLKNDIKLLSCNSNPSLKHESENKKKIVLYGVREMYKETDEELHDRIRTICWDILGIDLQGYIEDTYRIGRYIKHRNRPLVIELMSKRITKYITENHQYFYGTGLNISEFLNEEARNERKILRDKMLVARNKGQKAVIRNNRLYIEGELIDLGNETSTQLSSETIQNIHGNDNNRKSEPCNNHTFRDADETYRN